MNAATKPTSAAHAESSKIVGSATRAGLGFGCAALPVEQPRVARAILDHAFELGIRHFDVARLYGFGEAERILGNFLRDKRSEITITTKFGLVPRDRTFKDTVKARAIRALHRFPPAENALREAKRAVVGRAPVGNSFQTCFDLDFARKSLETSLRLLGTDYVDYWLLHEATAADASAEDLVEFLQRTQAEGKIRSFGIGTAASALLPNLDCYPDPYGVFQFDNHILNRTMQRFSDGRNARAITHGSLGGLKQVREQLRHQRVIAADFCRQSGLHVHSDQILASLLLAWSLDQNPGGIVLFASNCIEHITRNVATLTDAALNRTAVARFAEILMPSSTVAA